MSMDDGQERGMNIAIFEGGVAGGLSSLVTFKELIERLRMASGSTNLDELFEFIAGTGTGALIACMLGLLHMDVERAIATYAQLVERVFTDKKMISTSGSGTYKASSLENELKIIVRNATRDENAPMMGNKPSGTLCKVMVFAMSEHNMNGTTPRILRSYQGPNNQMPDCPIWQAVRASMAHPELFKSFSIGDGAISESLIGGDVGCSNPARHVLAEVSAMYPDRYVSSIVCIGAGHARTIQLPRSNPLQRFMPTNVLETMKNVATDSERVAQEMAAQFEDTSKLYWRFSVDQGMQDVKTSQWQKISQVVAHSRAYTHKTEVRMQMGEAAQAMVERKAVLKAKEISGKTRQVSPQQTALIKRCPAPSPSFTGCERQVAQVSNCLLGSTNERRVCVLHGLGGSGKTQIALKAIEQTLGKWSDVAYVDATSKETIKTALKNFALAKRIGKTHEDAICWLETSAQSWLLMLDNADDPNTPLASCIPGGAHGSVLITTRLSGLALLGQGPRSDCAVGKMERSEAVELLVKKARRQDEELSSDEVGAAEKLVEDLGYLALAVVHAGAYIWCSKISIAKYQKICQENTQMALEMYSKLPVNTEEYKRTVYTTWMMSYERLSPCTQQFLWILAYFHPDMIKEDIFRRAADNLGYEPSIPLDAVDQVTWAYVKGFMRAFLSSDDLWDSGAFSIVTGELLSYSLIDYDRTNDTYTLHTLVQDWACTVIPHAPPEGLKHASHLLAMSIEKYNDSEAYAYRQGLVLHISRILGASGVADANDAMYFARVYRESGQWKEEERLLTLVLKEQRHAHGDDHPDTLVSLNNLASNFWNQGRWSEAEALQVQVLDAKRRVHGEHHSSTLISMDNLASIYSKQGRWDKAEALQVQALDAMKRVHDEHHPNTLTSMSNLALTYFNQGRWDEAEALQVQVLGVERRVHGEQHPNTLISIDNLATTYCNQGRWSEAEELQVQVLDAMRQVHGEHHPSTLTSMDNLATTYWNQSRWSEAEALQAQVLDAKRRVHGKHHPNTLISMNNLASTYRNQGRLDEAEALGVLVLDSMRRVHGEQHPDTLISMSSLALTYSKQGRWDDAEALQVLALEAARRVYGGHHPRTLISTNNLALTYKNQGRWDEAEALQVQVLDAMRQVHGEYHPSTLIFMYNLGRTYQLQEKWDKAEVLQLQTLAANKRVFGEEHRETLDAMVSLANTYRTQGEHQREKFETLEEGIRRAQEALERK